MTKEGGMDGAEYIGTFNNDERGDVREIKALSAALINKINEYSVDKRRAAIACTHVETAAMFAVKSIFSSETGEVK